MIVLKIFKIAVALMTTAKLCVAFNFNDAAVRSEFKHPLNQSETMFGISVVLQRHQNSYRVVVGAPRSPSIYRKAATSRNHRSKIKYPGAVFACEESTTCKEIEVLISRPYTAEDTLLGMTIAGGSNSQDSSLLVCAPKWYTDPNKDTRHVKGMCFRNDRSGWSEYLPADAAVIHWQGTSRYYFGVGQFGFSATYLEDNNQFLIGVPGALSERGTVAHTTDFKNMNVIDPKFFPESFQFDAYFGYSITYGHFDDTNVIKYFGGAPRNADLKGMVIVYNVKPERKIEVIQQIPGPKLGSYFGASLEVARFTKRGTNNRKTHLLVGAPTWSENDRYDEGRVFVYAYSKSGSRFTQTQTLGDVDGKCFLRAKNGAKFGSTIANMGVQSWSDSNSETVAISAPFEDNGNGVVYLFSMGRNDVLQCTQRILAASSSLNHFGLAISRSVDIDGNRFNDVAIGGKDYVQVLRSKPVVSLYVTLNSTVRTLLQNDTSLSVRFCYGLQSDKSALRQVDVKFSFKFDVRAEHPRHELKKTAFLSGVTCDTLNVALKQQNTDFFNNFAIEMTYDLNANCPNCPMLDAIDDQSKIRHLEIPYSIDCGEDNICETNLSVDASFEENEIIVGENKMAALKTTVRNSGEPAYDTIIVLNISADINLIKCPSYCSNCQSKSIICKVESPLRTEKTLKFEFDVTRVGVEDSPLRIAVETKSTGVGKVAKSEVVLPIRAIYNASMTSVSNPIAVTAENNGFTHDYQLRNNGPSPFNNYEIYFDIPVRLKDDKDEDKNMFDVEILYNEGDLNCKRSTHQPLPPSLSLDENIPKNITTTLNCDNMICMGFVCRGVNLNKHASRSVRFTVKANVSTILQRLIMEEEVSKKVLVFATSAQLRLLTDEYSVWKRTHTYMHSETQETIAWWILALAIIAAILLLSLLVFLLYKCNFFKRLQVPDEAMQPLEEGQSFKDFKDKDEMYNSEEETLEQC